MPRVGGDKPNEATSYDLAKEAYEVKPPFSVDNFRLYFNSPTMRAWVNENTKTVVVAVRGTKLTDWKDLSADASLAFNRLTTTDRYKLDKSHLEAIMSALPPNEWEYYLTGHSLGGAIINQFKRDFPQIKSATEYNGAFSPWDLVKQDNESIKRIYASNDPLYRLGGRFFRNSTVVPIAKSSIDSHSLETLGKAIYGRGLNINRRKLIGGANVEFTIHRLNDGTWFIQNRNGGVIGRYATRREAKAIADDLNRRMREEAIHLAASSRTGGNIIS